MYDNVTYLRCVQEERFFSDVYETVTYVYRKLDFRDVYRNVIYVYTMTYSRPDLYEPGS